MKMNKNIELKAKARDFSAQIKIAQELSDSPQETLIQEDTFFKVENGRLKLRKFSEARGELIFYQRSDTPDAKQSSYKIYPTEEPDLLKETLKLSAGISGIVEKTRYLYFHGQIRIHFDQVKNLGEFIEFEYVLKPDEPNENGLKALEILIEKLEIRSQDIISHAYIDLLLSDQ